MESLYMTLKIQDFKIHNDGNNNNSSFDIIQDNHYINSLKPTNVLLRYCFENQNNQEFDSKNPSKISIINILTEKLKENIQITIFGNNSEKEIRYKHIQNLLSQVISQTNDKSILDYVNNELNNIKSDIQTQKHNNLKSLFDDENYQQLESIETLSLNNDNKIKINFQDDFLKQTNQADKKTNLQMCMLLDKQGLIDRINSANLQQYKLLRIFEKIKDKIILQNEQDEHEISLKSFLFAPVKDFERSQEKIKEQQRIFNENRTNTKLDLLKDLLRGTLNFRNPKSLKQFVDKLRAKIINLTEEIGKEMKIKNFEIEIVEIKNGFHHLKDKDQDTSQRDIKMIFKVKIDDQEEYVEIIMMLDSQLQNKKLDHKFQDFSRMAVNQETALQMEKTIKYQFNCKKTGKVEDSMIEQFIYYNLQKDKDILMNILNKNRNPFYVKQIEETSRHCIIDKDFKTSTILMKMKELIIKEYQAQKLTEYANEQINIDQKNELRKQEALEISEVKLSLAYIKQEKGKQTVANLMYASAQNMLLKALKGYSWTKDQYNFLYFRYSKSIQYQCLCQFKEANYIKAVSLLTKLENEYKNQFFQNQDLNKVLKELDQLKDVDQKFVQLANIQLYRARSQYKLSKLAEAEIDIQNAIIIFSTKYSSQHKNTAIAKNHKSLILFKQKKILESLETNKQVLKIRKFVLGIDHQDTTFSQENIARCYLTLSNENKYHILTLIAQSQKCLLLRNSIWTIEHDSLGLALNNHANYCRIAIVENFMISLRNNPQISKSISDKCYLDDFLPSNLQKILKIQKYAKKILNNTLGENHESSILILKDLGLTQMYLGISFIEKAMSNEIKQKYELLQKAEVQFQTSLSRFNAIQYRQNQKKDNSLRDFYNQLNLTMMKAIIQSYQRNDFPFSIKILRKILTEMCNKFEDVKEFFCKKQYEDLAYFIYYYATIFENQCLHQKNFDQDIDIEVIKLYNLFFNISKKLFSISNESFKGYIFDNLNQSIIDFDKIQFMEQSDLDEEIIKILINIIFKELIIKYDKLKYDSESEDQNIIIDNDIKFIKELIQKLDKIQEIKIQNDNESRKKLRHNRYEYLQKSEQNRNQFIEENWNEESQIPEKVELEDLFRNQMIKPIFEKEDSDEESLEIKNTNRSSQFNKSKSERESFQEFDKSDKSFIKNDSSRDEEVIELKNENQSDDNKEQKINFKNDNKNEISNKEVESKENDKGSAKVQDKFKKSLKGQIKK